MNENFNPHENYPDSQEKIDVPSMKVIPLKKICMTIGQLPTAYVETMSYYEMLIWFINYLRDNIIPTINGNGEAVEELQNVVMSLQNYINEYKDSIDSDVEELETYMNNYFDNLDVQEEINNKLDEMLEDGVLTEIIQQFVQSSALWCFNNVESMKQATNLIDGSFAKTLGYYSVNDGGKSNYKIRTKTNDDIIDDFLIVELNNNLIAELIVFNNEVNVKQAGAYGDKIHDDTTAFQNALSSNYNVYVPNGDYLITQKLIMPFNKTLRGENKRKTTLYSTINNDYTIQYGLNYDYNGLAGKITDLRIRSENNISDKPFGIFLNSSCTIKNVEFYQIGKAIGRTYSYIDMINLDNLYLGYCIPNENYIIDLNGNGDGIRLNQLKISQYSDDTSQYNSIRVTRSHGLSIKNSVINFGLYISFSNGVSIENCHFENNPYQIIIEDSDVSIKDSFIYKNESVNDIKLISSAWNNPSVLNIENVVFYFTNALINLYNSAVEEFDELGEYTILNIKNCFRQFNYADNNNSMMLLNGIMIKNFKEFNENSSDYSTSANIKKGKILNKITKSGNISVTSLGTIAKSNLIKWKKPNTSSLYYALVISVDDERKLMIGRSSGINISDLVTNENGVSIATYEKFGHSGILYRGSASNIFEEKCYLPSIGRNRIVDNGYSANCYPYVATSINNEIALFKQCDMYKKLDNGNVEVYMNSTPTNGTWTSGDKIINTNISSGQPISWVYDGTNWISQGNY